MQVECIDNSNRPSDVPISFWVKLKEIYSVIEVLKDMNGVEYYKLEEIPLEQANTLYKGFAASRFRILEDGGGDELVEELIKELDSCVV